MQIRLDHIGKRFGNEWIFRDVTLDFNSPQSYALLGANGSGKSTLLQIILGAVAFSKGAIHYSVNGLPMASDIFFRHCSFSSPYLELIEEFTLNELLVFHFSLKPLKPGLTLQSITEELGLEKHCHKPLKAFSSGMRQRVKLGISLFAETSVLLLDEPCTNLDAAGITWYQKMIEKYCSKQLVIVASNVPAEYDFCKNHIHIENYKQAKK
jgi:ABC-type multidrug transport system ATPase subunit